MNQLLLAHLLFFVSGQNLPEFPSKWRNLTVVPGESREGSPVGRLPAMAERPTSTDIVLTDLPEDREIKFSVWLRSADGQSPATVSAAAWKDAKENLHSFGSNVQTSPGSWVRHDATYAVPKGGKMLVIRIMNASKSSPLDIAGPTMKVGEPLMVNLVGPGIVRASCNTSITSAKGGILSFPVPMPAPHQTPLTMAVHADPPSALKSWRVLERSKDNWICQVEVAAVGDKPAHVRYESLVAVDSPAPKVLPKAEKPEAPPEAAAFLKSTKIIQSDDPEIRAKAEELAKDAPDVNSYVQRVAQFTYKNQGTGKPFDSLDAKTALGCGGSCTSRSYLGAALLRARGIPARTVPHLPTWSYLRPLYIHWLTEYWHPGTGWVPVETTLGVVQPPMHTVPYIGISSIEDEDRSGADDQHMWVTPGTAWMACVYGDANLRKSHVTDSFKNPNFAKPERRLDSAGIAKILEAGRRTRPEDLQKRSAQAEQIVLKGSVDDIVKLLK